MIIAKGYGLGAVGYELWAKDNGLWAMGHGHQVNRTKIRLGF